jgi:hypothetical protein
LFYNKFLNRIQLHNDLLYGFIQSHLQGTRTVIGDPPCFHMFFFLHFNEDILSASGRNILSEMVLELNDDNILNQIHICASVRCENAIKTVEQHACVCFI